MGYHPNHADAEVTVDFEMRNNNSTIYALDNDTGESKKEDIEPTVIRVRRGHIGEEPIEAESCIRSQPQCSAYVKRYSEFLSSNSRIGSVQPQNFNVYQGRSVQTLLIPVSVFLCLHEFPKMGLIEQKVFTEKNGRDLFVVELKLKTGMEHEFINDEVPTMAREHPRNVPREGQEKEIQSQKYYGCQGS